MKQTSLEWFFNELQRMQYFIGNDMVEAYNKAKEMEKQQIVNAYDEGVDIHCGKKYYNETFKEISYERTYDSRGNILTFKDSNGITRDADIPEYTMEELVEKLGNFKIKK